jgi:hypothetical protein
VARKEEGQLLGLFNDVGYFYYNQGGWTEAEKDLRLEPPHARVPALLQKLDEAEKK